MMLEKQALKWSAIERFSTQAIQFILMIVLARLLSPEMFGLIGMIAIFLAISQVFIDSGFSAALIRKGNPTETEYSTAFYFNVFAGLIAFIVIFSVAPWIGMFYGNDQLTLITRLLSINLIINSFGVVHRARLMVEMNFKSQTKASFIAVVIGGIVGVSLALNEFGVWALVTQTLTTSFLTVLNLWLFTRWVPKRTFEYNSFKEMFNFGSKLLASSLLDTFYNNIYLLVIGKYYSSTQLGFFTQAQKLSEFPSIMLTSIIQRVNFPVMSKIKSEKHLALNFTNTLGLAAFIIFPLMGGVAALSAPIIDILLGSNWAEASNILPFLCLSFMVYPIHSINLNILKVKNRSDLFLKLEVIKKIIITIMLFITVPIGMKAICIGLVFTSYISMLINMFYSQSMVNVKITHQLKVIGPIWFVAVISSIVTYFFISIFDSSLPKLLTGICLGSIIYFGMSKLILPKYIENILNFRNKNNDITHSN